jgi:beta-glucosidase
MPFRALPKMAGAFMDMQMAEDIVFLANGHFFRGLGRLIVDFVKCQIRGGKFVKTLESAKE